MTGPWRPTTISWRPDANYKRMVDFGLEPENIRAVRLGIASHNLFELAYAYLMARQNRSGDALFHHSKCSKAWPIMCAGPCRKPGRRWSLYAPVASRDQFINAIAYLIRRLDENTGQQNFLRHPSSLRTASRSWQVLADRFAGLRAPKTRGRSEAPPSAESARRRSWLTDRDLGFVRNSKTSPILTGP